MQGKETLKREGLTERLCKRDAAASRRVVERIGLFLMWGGAGYLTGLCRMLFETNPLGVALLCTGGNPLGIFLGLAVAEVALMSHPVLMICVYAAVGMIRGVSTFLLESPDAKVELSGQLRDRLQELRGEREKTGEKGIWKSFRGKVISGMSAVGDVFTESVCLRCAVAGVAMLVVGLFRIIEGGFRYYDLFAAVFAIGVAVAAVPVMSIRLEGRSSNRILLGISAYAVMAAMVWSGNFAAVGAIPVSAVLGLLFTLWATEDEGMLYGVGAGVLCGLAYRPILLPAFALGALVYGAFPQKRRVSAGIPLACLAALFWTVYADGAEMISVALPAYLLVGAIFSPIMLIRYRKAQKNEAETDAEPQRMDAETQLRYAKTRQENADDHFRNISDAFSSLSEIF